MMTDARPDCRSGDLEQANELMVAALELLDKHRHIAAAHLDYAIVTLGLRPGNEGIPPEYREEV